MTDHEERRQYIEGLKAQAARIRASGDTPFEEAGARERQAEENARYRGAPRARHRQDATPEGPRTRRTVVVFRQSLYDRVQAYAEANGMSVNAFVEAAAEKYLHDRGE